MWHVRLESPLLISFHRYRLLLCSHVPASWSAGSWCHRPEVVWGCVGVPSRRRSFIIKNKIPESINCRLGYFSFLGAVIHRLRLLKIEYWVLNRDRHSHGIASQAMCIFFLSFFFFFLHANIFFKDTFLSDCEALKSAISTHLHEHGKRG